MPACPAMSTVVVPDHFLGPPAMGHGGYVAGLFTAAFDGALQVTLRKPTPLGVGLDLVEAGPERWELRHDGTLLAEAEPTSLELDVPPVPPVATARAAEAGSPSHWEGHGVHPVCLGCGLVRDDDEGLAITVGPLEHEGHEQVAAVWRPGAAHASDGRHVDRQWVLAALDCPGAMAFIARGTRAGLLGRIVFEQFGPAAPGQEHVVSGWQIGQEGRKLFAGTALADADGTVLAVAKATWFGL